MFNADLYARSRIYIEATAMPRDGLTAALAADRGTLDALAAEGAMPAPTYTIYENAIVSPIRALGAPDEGAAGHDYFGPSVIGWLKHAALLREGKHAILPALNMAFADSFRSALRRQVMRARTYAWSHLFDARGDLKDGAVDEQIRTLSAEWMNGGWAVCLRQWDGHHVVTKDLERAFIGAITDDGARQTLAPIDRRALRDAIERLEAVMLPFAPYERPHGTPGLFIDRMRERYGV